MSLRLDDLRGPECIVCGTSIEHRRSDTIYCGQKCANTHYHQLEREARLAEKADRPPCRVCGKAIPAEAMSTRIYCSPHCLRIATDSRNCGRYILTCEHCGEAFHGSHKGQRFCSHWCKGQGDVRKHHPRPCIRCGIIYQPKRAAAKYCGSTCAALDREAKAARTERPCLHCEEIFTGQPRQKYCSPRCRCRAWEQAQGRA